ncbi:hypothetical protein B7486_57775, partial [cyanobacterium TDX16]
MVAITTFVVLAFTLIFTLLQQATYEAEAKVTVTQQTAASELDPNPAFIEANRFLQNERDFIESDRVQEAAAEALGGDAEVVVRVDDTADAIAFVATADSGEEAAEAANAYAEVYVEQRALAASEGLEAAAAELDTAIADLDAQMGVLDGQIADTDPTDPARQGLIDERTSLVAQQSELQGRRTQLQAQQGLAAEGPAQLSRRAEAPSDPASPDVARNTLLGLVLGFVLGLVIAFVLDLLDTSVRDRDQLEGATGLPVLGVLTAPAPGPDGRPLEGRAGLSSLGEATDGAAEAVRGLRTAVQLLVLDRGLDRLMIAPVRVGSHAADAAAELAVSLAQAEQRVLLVDTDLRRPSAHARFGLEDGPGLTDVLAGSDPAGLIQPVADVPGLDVLTSGPPPLDPSQAFATTAARDALQRVGDGYDLVLLV